MNNDEHSYSKKKSTQPRKYIYLSISLLLNLILHVFTGNYYSGK